MLKNETCSKPNCTNHISEGDPYYLCTGHWIDYIEGR